MAEHRFKKFLKSKNWGLQRDQQFVKDALDDDELPDATSWEELKAYLLARNPKADTDTAKAIWRFYSEKKG